MPVELQFQRDGRAAAEAFATDPPDLFFWTVLLVPVRFLIDGQNVLPVRHRSSTGWSVDEAGVAARLGPLAEEVWSEQPLIGLLVRLEQAVDQARRNGAARCLLIEGGDLELRLQSKLMLEVRSRDGMVASAPLGEYASSAILDFRIDAKTWLEAEAPHLEAHPAWGDWFPATP